jgi:hypothetical protein
MKQWIPSKEQLKSQAGFWRLVKSRNAILFRIPVDIHPGTRALPKNRRKVFATVVAVRLNDRVIAAVSYQNFSDNFCKAAGYYIAIARILIGLSWDKTCKHCYDIYEEGGVEKFLSYISDHFKMMYEPNYATRFPTGPYTIPPNTENNLIHYRRQDLIWWAEKIKQHISKMKPITRDDALSITGN